MENINVDLGPALENEIFAGTPIYVYKQLFYCQACHSGM